MEQNDEARKGSEGDGPVKSEYSVSEARPILGQLLTRVQFHGERIVIVRAGLPTGCVLCSQAYLQELERRVQAAKVAA